MSGEEAFLAALGADEEYDPAYQPAASEEDEEDYEPEDEFPATDDPKPDPEYDPSTYTNPTLRDDLNETPDEPSPPKQPKTRAGFVVDDDEDEDDEEEEEQGVHLAHGNANGNGMLNAAQAPAMSSTITQSPSNAFSANYVSLQQAAPQDQARSAAATPAVPSQSATPHPVDKPLGSAVPDQSRSPQPANQAPNATVNALQSPADPAATLNASNARLPSDHVGMLEDRIAEDPRGDLDAWLSLIQLHQKRNKLDEARKVYDRFFTIFPQAAEQWVAYANMELENNEIPRVTQILGTSLAKVRNVQLWKVYLDFVRRFNNLTTDLSGTARRTVSEAFERVLQEVGTDKDSGEIWREYIQFLRSGPGNLGGGGWQDQQKMDLLRKAYQRATSVPTDAVIPLWKEYDAFETGLNRTTGRKLLQERSPTYITARSANIALQNVTNGLRRTTLPRLPPALGFDGDVEYMEQVHLWQKWVEWEKEDPLVLKDEDLAAYNRRILYAYRQALMALWFWPPMWYDAIEFCFRNGMKEDGEKLLDDGTDANPESCLLAFRKADHLEMTTPHADGDDDIQKRADAIKQPYDKLLDTLYGLVDKVKAREARAAGIAKENFEEQQKREAPESDDEEDAGAREEALRKAALDAQLGAIKKGHAAQIKMISRTISFSWIALMRAMRRVQGKGKMVDVTHKGSLVKKEWVGGLRGYLREARGRGRMTSDVFVASALMEYHCYKDPASKRIFDAGFKLFPEDEQFALAYMKHLINTNDVTNARAVFETAVSKLSKKPENVPRAKVLFQFLHEYECQYGELSQIVKLEQRMADLFPEDPRLTRFTQRYIFQSFDPTAVRLVTSPAAQMRPKMALPPQIHEPAQTGGYRAPTPQISSPRPLPMQLAQPGQSPSALAAAFVASNSSTNSPKRPLPADESDNDSLGIGSRKLARTDRSESPLKGAAGRRLDAQRRLGGGGGGGAGTPGIGIQRGGVEPLPNMVMFLLGILPNAEKYQGSARFNAERVVDLLRGVDLGRANTSGGKRW